jgi:chromosome partitioning protein
MAIKIAFINGKGGCGKTTSIFHVAGVLSKEGKKVLVLDLDKQRNTTDTLLMNTKLPDKTVFDVMHGVEPYEATAKALFQSRGNANPKHYGVDCMASDILLENESKLSKVNATEFGMRLDEFINMKGYDWLLVDMPPSNKALNDICFGNVVDFLIVPLSSDVFSARGYGDLINTVQKARVMNPSLVNLGVYLAKYMGYCALDQYIRGQLMEEFSDMFIDIQIPLAADVRESVFYGRPISYYKKAFNSKSRIAYESLVDEIKRRIGDNRKVGI